MKLIFLVLIWSSFCLRPLAAQPYIDVASVRVVQSPDMGPRADGKNATVLNYINLSTSLPFFLKNKKDVIVISPFFERWSSTVANVHAYSQYHYGLALPVSFLKSVPNSNWTILTTGIIRMNDINIDKNGRYQFGGAVIVANSQKDKNLTYKIGVYINSEFFGLFIIPLIGIEWRINERTNLFGVLPASLTLEHKLDRHFYTGLTFRTFTNSYHDSAKTYFRVDENQLGIFFDYYINKHIVLNLEVGHSILRKIRSGIEDKSGYNWNVTNEPYFKFMLAYRIRTR